MRYFALLVVFTGCSWAFVKGPPPAGTVPRDQISCTTSYALPTADVMVGGVAAIPLLWATGVALNDAGKRSNGEDVADRDYPGKLLLASAVVATIFGVAEITGRQRVYECRRAKGLPFDPAEMHIAEAEEKRRLAFVNHAATCTTAMPEGSPSEVVLAEPEVTVLPCDERASATRGSVVIQGAGDKQIGALPGCSRFRDGCLGEPADDIRDAIQARLAEDPRGQRYLDRTSTQRPECPTMKLERKLYISVDDWRAANVVARAALEVSREKRLGPEDGIVIAVNGPCAR